jgi:CoA:oxalate CoA-transferase
MAVRRRKNSQKRNPMTKPQKPLAGVTVLDLTRVLAGPYCTMLLQDLGARVIKIEVPGSGDDSRAFGPFLKGVSLYFASINRGKESLSLNLKASEGKEILEELVANADVLVENFRPGTMEKLGVGYDHLGRINPRLVYAAASGFGHSGPDSTKPAYDILAQARGGVMSITGWPDGEPVRVGLSFGDLAASLFTAVGINAALYDRERTGKGQKVDVAMLDCQVALLENALVRFQVDGHSPRPLGHRHPTITPFQAVRTRDVHIVIAVGNDVLWQKFCTAVGHPHLIDDPRFATNPDRCKNVDALDAILADIFRDKTADEWLVLLEQAQIPSAPINDVERVMKDPQILAREMIVDLDDPHLSGIKVAGNPMKMSHVPETGTRGAVPTVGQHTETVLSELLGYSSEEIAALKEKGVV